MVHCFNEKNFAGSVEGDYIQFVTLESLVAALAVESTESSSRTLVWDGIHEKTVS